MKSLRTNVDIREKIDNYDLYYYEVADALKMKRSNFSVMLKMQLTEFQKEKIFDAIEKAHIKKERKTRIKRKNEG